MRKISFLLIVCFLVVSSAMAFGKQYHVSINGNDRNTGTIAKPFRTLEAARDALRSRGLLGKERCEVIIHKGTYRLTKPFLLRIQDSGNEEKEVIYRAAEGEKVVFTSAELLDLKWDAWKNGIYKAKLKKDKPLDQLIVNGELQPMARYPNYVAAKIDSYSANTAEHKTVPFNGAARDAWSQEKAKGWKNPKGAYMHAMHKALWGAFHITGAEDCLIKNCTFKQLGGNAVFVDGYNRRIAIKTSIFEKNGATDINFVGSPAAVRNPLFQYHAEKPSLDDIDTAYGPKTHDYPADCLVENCLMTQCGRIEKQTAGINISMSSRITVRHNTIFHVPRAAINICDGTWGGHLIEWNECFDTVLETGDHGAFNSWGRDRFWHWASPSGPREMDENGVPLITKMIERYHDVMLWDAYQTTTLRNNLWICDNGWDVDLDDGSTNYDIYNNLCLRGGLKTREGYHRKVYNNVIFNYFTCNVPYPKPTYDQFRSNIIIGKTYVVSNTAPWGGSRDYTFFHNPEYVVPIPATAIRDWTDDDANSLVGNAGFVDLKKGNFKLKTNSPAFKLGFKNFVTTGFGVTSEKLKRRVPEPVIILPSKYFDNTLIDEKKRSVWGATIGTLDTESKLTAYGAKSLEGAILSKLPEKSKLHKLGFRVDDVILKINQFKIGTAQDLIQFFSKAYMPGSAYQVKLLRGQKEIQIKF